MKKLNLEQMEEVEGGKPCGKAANRFIAITGLIAGVGASFGPIGLAIAGPTALGMGIAGLICAFKE